jgi:hypothetical protein
MASSGSVSRVPPHPAPGSDVLGRPRDDRTQSRRRGAVRGADVRATYPPPGVPAGWCGASGCSPVTRAAGSSWSAPPRSHPRRCGHAPPRVPRWRSLVPTWRSRPSAGQFGVGWDTVMRAVVAAAASNAATESSPNVKIMSVRRITEGSGTRARQGAHPAPRRSAAWGFDHREVDQHCAIVTVWRGGHGGCRRVA